MLGVKVCRLCGAPITLPEGRRGPRRRYCGGRCRDRASYERRYVPVRRTTQMDVARVCAHCGNDYRAAHSGSKYCSKLCLGRANADRLERHDSVCVECHNSYSGTSRQTFCSRSCRRKFSRRIRIDRIRNKENVQRFSPREIFERDDWVCHICGGACDPTVSWPTLLAATLDHLIPLSRGGQHTRDNVKCAHYSCNSRRGARILAECA